MLKNIPNPSDILDYVKKNNFLIVENAINSDLQNSLSKFWIDFFDAKNKKNFKSKDLYGSTRSIGDKNYNSYREDSNVIMYRRTEFPWNEAIHEPTKKLIYELNKIRNLSIGLSENHGQFYEPNSEVLFNQINCYPSGRGKMFPHKDTKYDKLLLSCMFNITQKNLHFEEGGLYLIINDKKIDIDNLMKPGSVVFYNGNLIHGVDKIVSKSGIGRIAGYPMKQFFLSYGKLPNYIKSLIRLDNGLKRKLNLKSAIKQGNSALSK